MRAVDADGRRVELEPLDGYRFRHPDGRVVGVSRRGFIREPGQPLPPGFWLMNAKADALAPELPHGWRRAIRVDVIELHESPA